MPRFTPWDTTVAVPTTAAVRATGRPTTPRRPTRAWRSGISGSFGHRFVRFGLDGGQDGLRGDAAAVDQVAAGMPHGCGERAGPGVLPDEDRSDAARLERLCD